MSNKKILAQEVFKALSSDEQQSKGAISDHLRALSDYSERYENMIFEIGVRAVTKEVLKLNRLEM